MPSLKAQEHGKSEALNAAMSHGRRLTNSIGSFCETLATQLSVKFTVLLGFFELQVS
jgi:hypothetical protein